MGHTLKGDTFAALQLFFTLVVFDNTIYNISVWHSYVDKFSTLSILQQRKAQHFQQKQLIKYKVIQRISVTRRALQLL